MPGTYLDNILDHEVRKNAVEPTPTLHRQDAAPPAVDATDPADNSGACAGAGWSSVIATWKRTGGGATPTIDIQILLWDPVSDDWDKGDVITGIAPGQLVVLPVGGCSFWVKIVGVTDVTGISDYKILLRPWASM